MSFPIRFHSFDLSLLTFLGILRGTIHAEPTALDAMTAIFALVRNICHENARQYL